MCEPDLGGAEMPWCGARGETRSFRIRSSSACASGSSPRLPCALPGQMSPHHCLLFNHKALSVFSSMPLGSPKHLHSA